MDGEQARHFEAFRDDILEILCPQGAIEEQLAERIALCWWRLRRVYRMEVAIAKEHSEPADDGMTFLNPKPSDGSIAEKLIAGPFQHLSRYETTIERSLQRALHELERWQARRKGEAVMAPIAVDVTHSASDEREPATGVTIEHANGQNGTQEPSTLRQQVRQRTRPPRPPSAQRSRRGTSGRDLGVRRRANRAPNAQSDKPLRSKSRLRGIHRGYLSRRSPQLVARSSPCKIRSAPRILDPVHPRR
jgi:hypothetical protein